MSVHFALRPMLRCLDFRLHAYSGASSKTVLRAPKQLRNSRNPWPRGAGTETVTSLLWPMSRRFRRFAHGHAVSPADRSGPNYVYGLLPQVKRSAVGWSTRESVAVVYPASDVGSWWPVPTWNLRTGSHTLRAIKLRSAELSAWSRAGPTVVAMMGGVSLRKPRKWVVSGISGWR